MNRSCTLRVVPHTPARKLVDWTEDAGPVEDWLARWAAAGWVPEHGYGVSTKIGGRDLVTWAMTSTGPATGEPEPSGEPPPFGHVAPKPAE